MSTLSVFSRMKEIAWNQYTPLTTTIELTEECNFKCLHCYNYDRSKNKRNLFFDWELFQRIVPEIKKVGGLVISLTGGEPLLYPWFNQAVALIKKNHMEVVVKTNGSYLSRSKIKELKDFGVDQFEISVYGYHLDTVKKFNQSDFDYLKLTDLIKNLKSEEMPFIFTVVLNRVNYKEYPLLIDLLNEYKAEFRATLQITKRYDGTDSSLKLNLTNKQLTEFYRSKYAGVVQKCERDPTDLRSLQCSCARLNCAINAKGIVYPCMGAPMPSGDLKQKSFEEIWYKSTELNWIRNLKGRDFKNCQTCSVIEYCDRSSGNIYSNTGKYTGCDEETFRVASLLSTISEDSK